MNDAQAVRALAALAQASRLAVFKLLVVAGRRGVTPSELAERLSLAASSLSFHLKELLHAELIVHERDGRHLIYRANLPHMDGLLAYLTDNCCEGEACLPVPACAAESCSPTQGEPMPEKIYNVLFLCTRNSARSLMAEACLNHLAGGRFRAFSAGSQPEGRVHPLTLELLARNGYANEALRSKSWDEFASADAPAMDFVFTVCDRAAAETCPTWPGQPLTAHWGVPDPAEATGSEDAMRKAFTDAFLMLHRRIGLLLSLPVDKLDRLSLQREVARIGQQ